MPATPDPQVSIIIPAYNEASRLPNSLRLLGEYLGAPERSSRSFEVLVVVEQSTDGTLDLATEAAAEQANFRVIDNQVHRGKGYAVRSGMRQARGAIAFYMDADLSVPLEEIDEFLAQFEAHPGGRRPDREPPASGEPHRAPAGPHPPDHGQDVQPHPALRLAAAVSRYAVRLQGLPPGGRARDFRPPDHRRLCL